MDLHYARRTIIDLVPKPLRALLDAHTRCDSFEDRHASQRWAVDKVIAAADATVGLEVDGYRLSARAQCPLRS
jgi:hypothetical protein